MPKPEQSQELADLENLFNSPGWDVLKKNIKQVYANADSALHAMSCSNRDIYVGKCLGIDEVLNLEGVLKADIEESNKNA